MLLKETVETEAETEEGQPILIETIKHTAKLPQLSNSSSRSEV